MHWLLFAIVISNLGAGAIFAQTGIGGVSPLGVAPGSPEGSEASLKNAEVLSLPGPSTTTPGASPPTGISRHRQSPSASQSQKIGNDSAVTDCMQMWDSGTHMTKQEWLRTCRRVQTRLDGLNVDVISPKTKKLVR
jgi:hypothetical protein